MLLPLNTHCCPFGPPTTNESPVTHCPYPPPSISSLLFYQILLVLVCASLNLISGYLCLVINARQNTSPLSSSKLIQFASSKLVQFDRSGASWQIVKSPHLLKIYVHPITIIVVAPFFLFFCPGDPTPSSAAFLIFFPSSYELFPVIPCMLPPSLLNNYGFNGYGLGGTAISAVLSTSARGMEMEKFLLLLSCHYHRCHILVLYFLFVVGF